MTIVKSERLEGYLQPDPSVGEGTLCWDMVKRLKVTFCCDL